MLTRGLEIARDAWHWRALGTQEKPELRGCAMNNALCSSAVNNTLLWCCLALIFLVVAGGLIAPLAILTYHIPLDPNEGWNAYFTRVAMSGGNLYPTGDLVTNAYPPLSFYIVGLAGLVTGDTILAGRSIALLATLAVAVNLYLWLRATTAAMRIALLGSACFLVFAVTFGQTYIALDDPQWLAHAIMTSGLVLLWRGEASTRAIVLASILMIAAGLTKHLLFPIPIAVTFWLMMRSRTALRTWIVSCSAVLAVAMLVVWAAYGPAFFTSLLTPRIYYPHRAWVESGVALRCLGPLLGLSLLLCLGERSERSRFLAAYLTAAAVVGGLASGGAGVDVNAFFDLLIASSLGSALAIDLLVSGRLDLKLGPESALGRRLAPIAIVLLTVCSSGYAITKVPRALESIRNLQSLDQESSAYIREIRDRGRGRAACEMLGLCYWANNSFNIDLFTYGQKIEAGALPITSCNSVFRSSGISLIQLQTVDRHGVALLPEKCRRVIAANYRTVVRSDLGVVLVARKR
jgi:hypothetical protein